MPAIINWLAFVYLILIGDFNERHQSTNEYLMRNAEYPAIVDGFVLSGKQRCR